MAAAGALAGWPEGRTFALLLVLILPIGALAVVVPKASDRSWLPNLIGMAWVVKMLAAAARYWALQVLYRGIGDATRYHGAGRRLAAVWRAGVVPPFDGGTEFVEVVTGLLYVPHEPTKLGGFFIFASLAFVGQLFCYTAFRHAFPSSSLKWYGVLILLIPNLLYWPASIGKDSLMVLFIGVAAYAAVRLLSNYALRWIAIFASGVAGCAVIRSHIALALVLALMLALLFGRSTHQEQVLKRVLTILAVGLVFIPIGQFAMRDFGFDSTFQIDEAILAEVIDPVLAGVEEQTARGGSEVQGSAIRSLVDIPGSVIRVLFRPLPNEAHNVQAFANSLVEGSLLLGLLAWRSPAIVRNLPRLWRSPYVLFSMVYTAGFIYGHSAVLNLGIMARQRAQAIPFVIVLFVVLGFNRPASGDTNSPDIDLESTGRRLRYLTPL